MTIENIRLLPPFATSRFGSSSVPLEAFDLEVALDAPSRPEKLIPRETLVVDPVSGKVTESYVPQPGRIRLRDHEGIRPVCPFFEVFAQTSDGDLHPLTVEMLRQEGMGPEHVCWSVEVGNLKAFVRPGIRATRSRRRAFPSTITARTRWKGRRRISWWERRSPLARSAMFAQPTNIPKYGCGSRRPRARSTAPPRRCAAP